MSDDRKAAATNGSASEPDPWADHFSTASADYRQWRPRYPATLFDWLAELAPGRALAWDCATGNGQAATMLAERFDAVVATDASQAQITEAEPHARVQYRVARAEASPLDDASADLVTVAQALHWFDVPRFWSEVRRVLRPHGVVAVWGYGLAFVGPGIDEELLEFSAVTVGPDWPPERALVEAGYRDLSFPFEVVSAPAFSMTADWNLARLMAYLGTWSSVKGYRERTGDDPLPALAARLARHWGDPAATRTVSWPLVLKVGRV